MHYRGTECHMLHRDGEEGDAFAWITTDRQGAPAVVGVGRMSCRCGWVGHWRYEFMEGYRDWRDHQQEWQRCLTTRDSIENKKIAV